MDSREELIRILMERDGISRKAAISLINECREAIIEEQSDEPIMDILGLEPDYLFAII